MPTCALIEALLLLKVSWATMCADIQLRPLLFCGNLCPTHERGEGNQMRNLLHCTRAFFIDLWLTRRGAVAERPADGFLDELFDLFPFGMQAQRWLREHVRVEIKDRLSAQGGGFFFPGENRVLLNTGQYEAAIHELAHAWWDARRAGQVGELFAAVVQAAEETDPSFARIARLARGYVHGLPDEGFPGFLRDRNDWETFAGLASGCMADIRLLPPYLRPFFEGLFDLLPADAPPPERTAPHR